MNRKFVYENNATLSKMKSLNLSLSFKNKKNDRGNFHLLNKIMQVCLFQDKNKALCKASFSGKLFFLY